MIKRLARWILRHEEKMPAQLFRNLEENISDWQRARDIATTKAFRTLVTLMANDVENREQTIHGPSLVHKFWYYQGAKFILLRILQFGEIANRKIDEIVEAKKPKPKEKEPASSYD